MNHIYLRTRKKVTIVKKRIVTIEDIADIEGPRDIVEKLKRQIVMHIPEDKKKNYLLTSLEVLRTVNLFDSTLIVHPMGEEDIIVSYLTKPEKKENQLYTFIKIIFVALTLFAGGAVAIMTFQLDTQLSNVFSKFYFIVLGDNEMQPSLIEIPYAIGLAAGIIMFFNHFSKLKLSDDPTPIQVELELYKNQVDDSIIETLKEEAAKKKDDGKQ